MEDEPTEDYEVEDDEPKEEEDDDDDDDDDDDEEENETEEEEEDDDAFDEREFEEDDDAPTVETSPDRLSSIDSYGSSYSPISYWSIGDTTPSFLDFENYEVHHWGMVAGGVITLFTMLAYYLVFRKNAKYRHLMPSSKGKSSYERLDDDADDDTDTYTYDEESP